MSAGQWLVFAVLGPGDDPDNREKATEGRWYTAHAAVVHLSCSGAPEPPDPEET